MRCVTLAFLVLAAAAAPLSAQAGTLQGGATVRATLNTGGREPLIGTLVSRTPDSLTIVTRGTDGAIRLPSSAVTSLEVLNGKRRLEPAVQWAVVGGGLWAVVAAVMPYDNCAVRRTEYCANSRGEFVGTQALGMGVIMGVVGAVKGADRWVRIEGSGPTAFVVPSARGTAAGVRFAF